MQALCESNPDIHLKKAYDSKLSSVPSLERRLSPPWSSPASSFPFAPPSSGASTKLLSVEKGPCEYCHELIPLSDLIKHEVIPIVNMTRGHECFPFVSRQPVSFHNRSTILLRLLLLLPQSRRLVALLFVRHSPLTVGGAWPSSFPVRTQEMECKDAVH